MGRGGTLQQANSPQDCDGVDTRHRAAEAATQVSVPVRSSLPLDEEWMRAQRLESLALLAAGISHDLRNLLQPLLMIPDLLRARKDDPALHHLADVIAECAQRGHAMTESMLSFIRGTHAPREQVRISAVFEAVDLLLRSSVPTNIALEVEPPAPEARVWGNFTELQQVLLNLALNAIQALPQGGHVWLQAVVEPSTQAHGVPWVVLQVRDDGQGMDASTLSQLFTPFFTTRVSGTGLGLVSCKRIVEAAGGTIGVSSRPGEGSCFTVRLPQASTAAAAPLAAQGTGEPLRVVDGERTRRGLHGRCVGQPGRWAGSHPTPLGSGAIMYGARPMPWWALRTSSSTPPQRHRPA